MINSLVVLKNNRNLRNSINADNQYPAPVFILFLDCCNQLLCQYPALFEFTSFYLEAMAYHVYSGRFSTFLLDCDYERIEAGILFEAEHSSHCFWNYVERATTPDNLGEVNHKLVNVGFVATSQEVILTSGSEHCFNVFQLFTPKSVHDTAGYDALCNEAFIDIDEVNKNNYTIDFSIDKTIFNSKLKNNLKK